MIVRLFDREDHLILEHEDALLPVEFDKEHPEQVTILYQKKVYAWSTESDSQYQIYIETKYVELF